MFFARVLTCFSVLLFALLAAAETAQDPTAVQIDRTFVPDNCELTAQKGDRLTVHYTGKLMSTGKKFDSSLDRGQPFTVTLGAGQVIAGWEEGLLGMCEAENRTLNIPAAKAYGPRGFGSVIPPNSPLVFDVELVKLTRSHEEL